MMRLRLLSLLLPVLLAGPCAAQAAGTQTLWAERVKCVVAVEFFTETELDRRSTEVFGVVADDAGTIIFPAAAVNPRVTANQLKDFRVYLPGSPVTNTSCRVPRAARARHRCRDRSSASRPTGGWVWSSCAAASSRRCVCG